MIRGSRILVAVLLVAMVAPFAALAALAATVTTLESKEPVKLDKVEFNKELTALKLSKTKTVSLGMLVKIEFAAVPESGEIDRKVELFMRNGDILYVDLAEVKPEALIVKSPLLGAKPVTVSIDDLVGIIFHEHMAKGFADAKLRASFTAEARATIQRRPDTDTLFIRGGKLDGLFNGFKPDTKELLFRKKGAEKDMVKALDKVLALHIQPLGEPRKPYAGPFLVATDTLGRRFSGTLKKYDAKEVVLQSNYDITFHADPSKLVSLKVRNARFTYLSDLDTAKAVVYHDYFEEPGKGPENPRTMKIDRSAGGSPLTLRGRRFDKGLGMFSQMTAEYKIGGKGYTRFRSSIGIDDAAGHSTLRSVEFKVILDGKIAYTKLLNMDETAIVDLKIPKGAKTLALMADFGRFVDILDMADWAGAMLLK